MSRLASRPLDWGPALAALAVQLAASHVANGHQPAARPLDGLAYTLLTAGPVLLLARRYRPVPVLRAILLVTAGYVLAGYGYGPVFMSLVIAFLTAAVSGPRTRTYPLLLIGYLVIVWPTPVLLGRTTMGWVTAAAVAAWLAVLVSVAEGVRQRRAVVVARRQRADAARRDEQAQRLRRASEERLAIARELHDVLGHSLSMINVQSSVALELFERKPEQAAVALAAIRDASRDALGEVHTLLRSIRGDEAAPTAPVPSIADLDAVVQHARAAGLTVRTTIDGTPIKLPSVVDVAAARILREALTNIVRHAPAAEAVVVVSYTPDTVAVRVDNAADPHRIDGTNNDGAGSGITGMRERAEAIGGTLTAGRRADGGFQVLARLPLRTGGATETGREQT